MRDRQQSDPHDLEPDDLSVLVEVAKLYYEDGLNQAQIGQQLELSRSTVSRLLKDARRRGVVKIEITYQWARDSALERDLVHTFGVPQVRVLRSDGRAEAEMIGGLGYLAGQYLDSAVCRGMVLGVSYGRSVAGTVQHVRAQEVKDLTIVQIIGALGSGNPLQDGPDLARQLANKYSATYRYLHAPLLARSRDTRDRLLQEPLVYDLLETARGADIVLTGVGALSVGSPSIGSASVGSPGVGSPSTGVPKEPTGLIFQGYLSQGDVAGLEAAGAVGHICAQFYGADGQLVAGDVNDRAITIGLSALQTVPTVIVVAGGAEKVRALRGALYSGYTDVLVTDDVAARGVLASD